MNINFYYDTITPSGPVPNGVANYCIDEEYWPHPFGDSTAQDGLVEVISSFYYSMLKNDCEVTLFTGVCNYLGEHLFYPFEVSYGMNVCVPQTTLDYIRSGKMKILILGQTLQGYTDIMRLKNISEMFMRMNIPSKSIIIVTGDVNNSYQELLQPCKTYGIDWWQIEARLMLNENTEKYNKFFAPINPLLPVKEVDMDAFDPKLLFHTHSAYDSNNRSALIESLKTNNLYDKGTITSTDDNIDYHTNSLFTILTPFAPSKNEKYMSEVNALFTDLDVWQLIVMGKPFIVLGCQQTVKYLNTQGYFTFYDLINEKYDSYIDLDIKTDLICKELSRVNSNTPEDTKTALTAIKKFAEINKAKFLGRSHMPKFLNLFDEIRYR